MNQRCVAVAALILILSGSQAIAIQNDKISVAVIQLDSYGIQKAEVAILTDRLRNELVKTGRFRLMEREKMDEILKEQGFQQTGCTSTECMVEVGRSIGVQQMIGAVWVKSAAPSLSRCASSMWRPGKY